MHTIPIIKDADARKEMHLVSFKKTGACASYDEIIELASDTAVVMGRIFRLNDTDVNNTIKQATIDMKRIDFSGAKLLI